AVRVEILRGEANRGSGSGSRSSLAVGTVPQCGDVSFRMGVGHVAIGAPGRHHFVGYTRTRRVEALARLVPLRMVVGLHADDQSVPGFAPPFPARMGGVPSVSSEPTASRNGIWRNEAGACGGADCHFMLSPLDHPQL